MRAFPSKIGNQIFLVMQGNFCQFDILSNDTSSTPKEWEQGKVTPQFR